MKLYKLTDENDETYGHTQWGENVSHTATGTGGLCSSGVIHAYTDPLLAVFFNPVHGCFKSPRLWEAESGDEPVSDGAKVGVKTLTTVRVVDLPEISTTQRVEIAIRCALVVCHTPGFETWANNWLSGKDRTEEAAEWAAAAAAKWTAAAARAAAEAQKDFDVLNIIKKVVSR